MEEIRRAAHVHYGNMPRAEQDEVKRKFDAFDLNRDGRISLGEISSYFNWMPPGKIDSLFRKLDTDGSDFLEFHEFVTLQYAIVSRPICDCCMEIVMGLYFCCVRCWEMYENSRGGGGGGVEFQPYEVCSDCYYEKRFRHDQHHEFLDNFVMFRSKPRSVAWREARKAGQLYFETLTRSEPDLNVARNLFSEMDLNGDGFVHWSEIVHFLARKGGMTLEEARRICLNMGMVENTYISFEDVVASWYIFVMRPWCDRCGAMIMGSYYSCVACFNSNTYDLCPECYRSGNFSHQHQIFLDNYVLLHQKTRRQGNIHQQSMVSSSSGPQGTQIMVSSSSGPQGTQIINMRYIRKVLEIISFAAAQSLMSAAAGAVCTIM